MANRFEHIESEIMDQYLHDENPRPWIVGFSGGKDSTVLLQMVWKALLKIPRELRQRDIHVVCNDTLVENPIISEYVNDVLVKIKQAAREQSLPIFVKQTTPRLENSFWLNLIGKGYPAPNNMFRWCTERLKIKPTKHFLDDTLEQHKEAIVLLGSRSAESSSRAQTMKKHEIKGSRLTRHGQQRNTMVYAPIKDLWTEEVWYYINTQKSPWGVDNKVLYNIYADATADDYECPTVVVNKAHQSCGQSRFGCWVCTVVKQDKSMTALIENGLGWMKPLLELRNRMVEDRNKAKNRIKMRRNGSEASWGAYQPHYRAKLLEELLRAQKIVQNEKPNLVLISNQELIAIQTTWLRDSIFEHNVAEIYNKVFNKKINMGKDNEKIQKENELLKKACKTHNKDYGLIQQLLELQKNKSLLNKKRGLKEDIEKHIEAATKN